MFMAGSFYLSQRLKAIAPVVTLMPGGAMEKELEAGLREKGFRVVLPEGQRPPKTGVLLESSLEGPLLRVRLLRATNCGFLREARFDARSSEAVRELAKLIRETMSAH